MDFVIIFCAQYLIWAVGAAFAVFLWLQCTKHKLLVTIISLPLAYAVAKVAGHFYSHVQPFVVQGVAPLIPHVVDNSFPSDHMLIASVFASIALAYDRTLGLVLWACAILIGVARVVALLHYPVDVVASAAIAAVVVALVYGGGSLFFQR